MNKEQKRQAALDKLIEAKGAYSAACSEVQKIIRRFPTLEMRSPEVIADLAVKRWVQGKTQKARMIAQAEFEALKPYQATPDLEIGSVDIAKESFRNSPMFKEIALAALKNRPEFTPATEFDYSSLESEPIQCGELRVDISSPAGQSSPVRIERVVDPLEEFDLDKEG